MASITASTIERRKKSATRAKAITKRMELVFGMLA
jgi:hypothetical protein